MVSFIRGLDLNKELNADGYDLVDNLKQAHSRKKKNNDLVEYLSFASKFCHHCCPNKYPIYDSINVRVFNVLFVKYIIVGFHWSFY